MSVCAQSCPTLCDPKDSSPPCFSVHGIFQPRILEWVAISLSKRSSWPRDWTHISCVLHCTILEVPKRYYKMNTLKAFDNITIITMHVIESPSIWLTQLVGKYCLWSFSNNPLFGGWLKVNINFVYRIGKDLNMIIFSAGKSVTGHSYKLTVGCKLTNFSEKLPPRFRSSASQHFWGGISLPLYFFDELSICPFFLRLVTFLITEM